MGLMNNIHPEKAQPPFRQPCVCPWWLCFTFDNVFRKLLQNPESILKPYIMRGWTVLDIGPGIGYFTIPLAKLVGDTGKVIAADLQQKMLDGIFRRAQRAGVEQRIQLQLSTPDSIGIDETVDFCLAFWMVHEVSDQPSFLVDVSSRLKRDGLLLFVEPRLHVSKDAFNKTLAIAGKAGLSIIDHPRIFLSYSALLKKN